MRRHCARCVFDSVYQLSLHAHTRSRWSCNHFSSSAMHSLHHDAATCLRPELIELESLRWSQRSARRRGKWRMRDYWTLLNELRRLTVLDMGKRLLENLRAISRNCGNANQIKLACFPTALSSNSFLGSRIEQYSCLELLNAFSQLRSGRWPFLLRAAENQLQTTSCRFEWKLTAEIDFAGTNKNDHEREISNYNCI